MIDSHAHVYMDAFDADRKAVLARSRARGITKIYMPNVDLFSIEAMLEVEEAYPDYCVAMMGLHPCYVGKNPDTQLYQIETWLSQRAFAAVGEIGLDRYHDKRYLAQQKEAFATQLRWAVDYKLPVVIHCREAMEETIKLVEEVYPDGLKGVFHCFTGTLAQAQRITEKGFYIGLGGISTFKNGGLKDIIPHLDARRMVLETDSPYLSPAPHRGRRNEPSYLPHIAEAVATLRGAPTDMVVAQTLENTETLFGR